MIDVLFAGDFSPCRNFESIALVKKTDILGDARSLIQQADISFTNLECPLTNHNTAINKSGPALKADPLCIEALKDFSVIGLANNHILDYGKKGLEDTMKACEICWTVNCWCGYKFTNCSGAFYSRSSRCQNCHHRSSRIRI